jgi:hypothetical protein
LTYLASEQRMDNRKHLRITLRETGWQADLTDQVNGNKLGELINLSAGGMMLITERDLEVESLHQVECRAVGPGGKQISFGAGILVLWKSETSQRQTYWVGLQIIDIDAPSKARLVDLSDAMKG